MTELEAQRHRIWQICQDCALSVYDTKPPTQAYAHRVARILYGTAAQEGAMKWERQRSVRFDGTIGGFSKWQLEPDSIRAGLAMMRARPGLSETATSFLFDDPHAGTDWIKCAVVDQILQWMRLDDNDKIGCLFARLHYLRVPEPIPDDLRSQGEYWKEFYNTFAGKGTVAEYMKNWYAFTTPDMA